MYCDNCGAENRDDANFCYKCSQSLSHIRTGQGSPDAAEVPVPSSDNADDSDLATRYSRILGKRYDLKEKVAHGGMGVLYRAYDRQLGMDVVVKFLRDRLVNDGAAIESLKREAKAAMKLAHPNIIRLYNFEETPGAKYLFMEFVEGESLASMASRRQDRRFTEAEVLKYIPEVCEALKYAHAEEGIHKDIKPSNILITNDHRVKLAEFGIANIDISQMEEDGRFGGGTLVYMSPEQIFGQPLDGRTDIYSLGITMYEMLSGAPPFRGKDVSLQHLHVNPKPIEGVSLWMNTVVLKCLRKEPDGRWQTAAELKDVLTGKQDIGVSMGKYLPWWLRNTEDLRLSAPVAPSPPPSARPGVEAPQLSHAEVYKAPVPERSARVVDYVAKIEKTEGLGEHAPEREQARMAVGALAGLIGGLIIAALEKDSRWPLSHNALYQLSLLTYGAFIGAAVGIVYKKRVRGLLSLTLGMLGGAVATLVLNTGFDVSVLGELKAPYREALCVAIIGGFIGIADGIYEMSFKYLLSCILWGAVGGAAGFGVFVGVRRLSALVWSPSLDWIVLGVALGFFIHMAIAFVQRPWKKR